MKGFNSNALIDSAFGWRSISVSNTGKVRKINEDSCMENKEQAHWAVADGMGGHHAGDLASQMIINNLSSLRQSADLASFIDQIEDTLLGVNENLYQLAKSRNTVIGSTIVGAVLNKAHILLYWAGDSRGYVFRNMHLSQLTRDHTLVQDLLDENKISLEQARNHPEKNVITRAVGSHQNLFVDCYMMPIKEGDIFIICSDGIEKEIDDMKLESILKNSRSLKQSAEDILDNVLNAGARDNVSFVLIEPVSLNEITRQ
ncbi:PP2C family protein-serine/threonine phosphatase [Rheinheimera maricola]|uniref:Protein phosphatase 2C domain-containing protein n=1 Tax=Rheinheimera maricola TaxID=2793282 RepID=A0ABS7XE82_9GAMM|nr:protein phosphatase 2C domain-containing protein [Rheinheimera maricola]MBZ9613439.1 protein phosphatase 2C domain-containing protein [Rheinheimera maricola]